MTIFKNESEPTLHSDGILKHVFYEFKITRVKMMCLTLIVLHLFWYSITTKTLSTHNALQIITT